MEINTIIYLDEFLSLKKDNSGGIMQKQNCVSNLRQGKQIGRRTFIKTCGAFIGMLSITPSALAGLASESARITILVTSDLHGNILGWDYLTASPADVGLAKVYTLVKQEREKNPNNILIDNGDILQGTPLDTYYSTINKGWKIHPMFEVFNAMNYDAIVLGNHEFNYGLDLLQKAIAPSKAPILSANTFDIKTAKTWKSVKPYTFKKLKINGAVVTIGIIGLTTNAIPNWENAGNYAGLEFKDQVEILKKVVKEIKDKVDIIIVASHSGIEIDGQETIAGENQIAAIAHSCPEVSLIIAGHKHITIDNNNSVRNAKNKIVYDNGIINNIPVIEPNCWGKFLGKAELELAKVDGKWRLVNLTTSNITTKGVAEDAAIITLAKPYHEATVKYLDTKIGTATAEFTVVGGTIQDTPLVDLINKVQRYYGKAQLSAAATFNPQAVIKQGDIKLQHIYSLYIYENYMYTIEITGSQLLKYLEHAARYYKQAIPGDATISTNNNGLPDYNYDMVAGVDYVIDITKPEGQRIKSLTYNGEPVKVNDSFTLAINNYRANGGGGYMTAIGFRLGDDKSKITFDSMKTYGDDGQVRNLIIRYIKEKRAISPGVSNNWKVTTTPVD
jgi:2',3'-cyclic-nucleotide 2'-phosphodiesterase (5'-nucleotidase family)